MLCLFQAMSILRENTAYVTMPTYGNAHIALSTRETERNLYVDAL